MIFYRAMPIEADGIREGDYLTPSLRFAREHALTTSVYHGEDYGVFVVLLGKDEYREASNPGEYIYIGEGKEARLMGIAKYNDEWADSEYQRVKLGAKEQGRSRLALLVKMANLSKNFRVKQKQTKEYWRRPLDRKSELAMILKMSSAGLQQAIEADRQRESDFNRARELEADAQAIIDAGKKELTPTQDTVVEGIISKLLSFTSAYGLGSSALMYKAKGLLSPGTVQTLKSLTRVSFPAALRLAGWIGIAVMIYAYLLSPEAEDNRDIVIAELETLAEELKREAYKLGLNPL